MRAASLARAFVIWSGVGPSESIVIYRRRRGKRL
jgi:hypothetical protein